MVRRSKSFNMILADNLYIDGYRRLLLYQGEQSAFHHKEGTALIIILSNLSKTGWKRPREDGFGELLDREVTRHEL